MKLKAGFWVILVVSVHCCLLTAEAVLRVKGRFVYDKNEERVIFRGIEHVTRWGDYKAPAPWGDGAWEGWGNDDKGAQLGDIAKTKANAVRILGAKPDELENLLYKAIVEQKMWVSVARVNWRDPKVIAACKKYEDFIMLHAKGETPHRKPDQWKTEAMEVVKQMRALGYKSPLEILSTGFGQEIGTLKKHGEAVFASDPDKNVVFGIQMYTDDAKNVKGALKELAEFKHPVMVGSCLFTEGISAGWGNNSNTYKEVWDGSYERELSSFYWSWSGDGHKNSMTSKGTYETLNDIGKYIVRESPAALEKKSEKSSFLLGAVASVRHMPEFGDKAGQKRIILQTRYSDRSLGVDFSRSLLLNGRLQPTIGTGVRIAP